MSEYARSERSAMCDLMLEVGADAPTLCEGWAAKDLAAHIVLRDSRPDLTLGILIPPLADRLDRAIEDRAETTPYPELVEQARAGAPWWNPAGPLMEKAANEVEFFVHHEDVRRAQPDWEPRELPADQQTRLWERARGAARLMLRKSPVGVVLVAPGHGRARVTSGRAREGAPAGTVVVTGAPAEVLLWVYGRREHAQVEVTGEASDVAALKGHETGI